MEILKTQKLEIICQTNVESFYSFEKFWATKISNKYKKNDKRCCFMILSDLLMLLDSISFVGSLYLVVTLISHYVSLRVRLSEELR